VNDKGRSFKVGIFVFAGLVLATIAVFLIGDNRRAWDRKITVQATFNDVVGLRVGSPVRMGGIDIGSVTAVRYADDPADQKIYVSLALARTEARRVRPDTTARIVGKGLLGDKMVELIGGDPAGPAVAEGGFIASESDPKDLGKALEKLEGVAAKADLTMEAVQKTSEQLADPQMAEDLRGGVKSMRAILDGVANEDGVAHRLIFDKEEARRVDRILANLDQTTANLARVSADARDITARAKTGPGLVHTLVYDEKLGESTVGTMAEVHGALQGMRTGNGLAHAIVYGDDEGSGEHVMKNLSQMSDDLRKIVSDMRAGRGTIGGLLVDPSVYEDVKSIVGNVERNQVLRALVRYSIKKNEDQPRASVKSAPPASVPDGAGESAGR
jgi:phospholipid/cholesterol/gamma-HCH transport system substrate-binding protein